MQQTIFNKGDKVQVSDGTVEPPKRHTRKHSAWEMNNFTGWVHRVEKDGSIAVDQTGQGMFCMVIRPWERDVKKLDS